MGKDYELVFLYIENFRNIKKEYFNFSDDFRITFKNYKLIIKQEKKFNIFPKNISLKVLVGKNGSGKTSILEVLKYMDCEDCFVILYSHKLNGFYIIGNFKTIKKNKIESDILEQNFKVLKRIEFKHNHIHNIFSSKSLKYFHDFDNGKQFSKHLANIGDEYLYEKFSENIQRQYNHVLNSFTQIKEIYKNELLQYGISVFFEKSIEFPKDWQLPKKIFISFNHLYVFTSYGKLIDVLQKDKKNIMQKLEKYSKHMENNDKVLQLKEQINSIDKKIKYLQYIKGLFNFHDISGIVWYERENWQNFIKYLSILNFITQSYQGVGSLINENILFEAINSVMNLDDSKAIDSFIEFFNRDFEIDGALYSIPKEYFFDIEQMIKLLELYNHNFIHGRFEINLSENVNTIVTIIKLHQKITVTVAKFLKFDLFPWMSDGHEEFFYIFAKIYMAINTPFDNKKPQVNDTVIMLLDEIINFLHPNWQREFLDILINFLERNYPMLYFQIILTTHSPFILSDIPKEDVIFLRNGKKENININTFGANIHSLLNNAFFMENGLIGEFAKSKINEVIAFLNGNESTSFTKKEVKNIINLIGEPFLKQKLQQIYEEKFGKIDELEKLKRQKEELERKIQELENKEK